MLQLHKVNNLKSKLAFCWLQVISVILMTSVQADQFQWYLGGSIGLTQLEPDTNGSIYTVNDDQDSGYKLYAGYDITERWTVEGFWVDLGKATLIPDSGISYEMKGVGINYYFPASQPGISGFVKVGVGQIENTGTQINFRRVENAQLYAGGGLEYQLNNGLSVRGEYEYYDEDAQFLSMGFAWRFGNNQPVALVQEKEITDPGVPEMQVIERQQEVANDPFVQVMPETTDRDSKVVGASGVDKQVMDLSGTLEGVTFLAGSDKLTTESISVLSSVVEQLKKAPGISIYLIGYTDNLGSSEVNMRLSFNRARSVAMFLTSNGIDISRVQFRGEGESRPRASNDTAAGRALNRRVELNLNP